MSKLKLHSEPLQDSWLDAYGHLNEAFYLVPFSNATWRLQDHFGIGLAYFEETGGALYTAETHLRYLAEVRAPAHIEIESFVIDSDAKRLWFAHEMIVDGSLRATAEFMTVHFDSRAGKTSPFSEDVQSALRAAVIDPRPGLDRGPDRDAHALVSKAVLSGRCSRFRVYGGALFGAQ